MILSCAARIIRRFMSGRISCAKKIRSTFDSLDVLAISIIVLPISPVWCLYGPVWSDSATRLRKSCVLWAPALVNIAPGDVLAWAASSWSTFQSLTTERTSRCELLSTQTSRKQQHDRAIKRQFQNIFYWSPNPEKKRRKPQEYKKRSVCLRRRNSQESICRNEITSRTALFIIRCFTSADMQNCSLELDRLRRWIWCQLKNISHQEKTKKNLRSKMT